MSLRVVAKPLGDNRYEIGIRGADVVQADASENAVHFDERSRRVKPVYPDEALRNGVGGMVYLLLQIGKQGAVENVAAEQVNLYAYGDEKDMARFRDILAKAAIKAAKHWQYVVPAEGANASSAPWLVRVPVSFNVMDIGIPKPKYGQWAAYVPGPRMPIPWSSKEPSYSSVDAIPDGSVSQVDKNVPIVTLSEGT